MFRCMEISEQIFWWNFILCAVRLVFWLPTVLIFTTFKWVMLQTHENRQYIGPIHQSAYIEYSCLEYTLIKKISSQCYLYIRKFRRERLYISAFPHILGSPSSYMTLQPLPSEFSFKGGKFNFLFYQCKRGRRVGLSKLKMLLLYRVHLTPLRKPLLVRS